jgi:hypothetical protein
MIIAAPGRTKIYIDSILDKRTLTNVQRAEMGLSRRGGGATRGQARGSYHLDQFQKPAEVFTTSPQVRLADQLREMFAAWPEWIRALNR